MNIAQAELLMVFMSWSRELQAYGAGLMWNLLQYSALIRIIWEKVHLESSNVC